MAAPHKAERIGETWNPERLVVLLTEIEAVRDLVTLSGGWAWHFMTPPGHAELKHAHDHKDADLFVEPPRFGELVVRLKQREFEKTWTRFDNTPGSETFTRYVKTVETEEGAGQGDVRSVCGERAFCGGAGLPCRGAELPALALRP